MKTDREEKFKSLATIRTNKTIKQIRLIGNLSDKSNYKYNKKQIDAIINAIDSEFTKMKERFENAGETEHFKLDD